MSKVVKVGDVFKHPHELMGTTGWKKAEVVFSEDSFAKEYSEESRTYIFYSGNKYFDGSMIGKSLFANCKDGTDQGVRLDWYMFRGNEQPWKPIKVTIIE